MPSRALSPRWLAPLIASVLLAAVAVPVLAGDDGPPPPKRWRSHVVEPGPATALP